MATLRNPLAKFNRTPPVAVRAYAIRGKKGGPPGDRVERIPLNELVEKSGISRRRFQQLSYLTSWENVTVGDMCAFSIACGVDISKKNPLYELNRKHGDKKLSFLTTRQKMAADRAIKRAKETKNP